MDRLRNIWSENHFLESARSATSVNPKFSCTLYVLCMHSLIVSLKHVSLVVRLLYDGKLPRRIFEDFVDYCTEVGFRLQFDACLNTDFMTLHFTPDLFILNQWVKTDNVYHGWFFNMLYNCGRIHNMNPMTRAHIIHTSYLKTWDNLLTGRELINVCKYCVETIRERTGHSYFFRAISHTCDTNDNFPTRIFTKYEVWCCMCKQVPLVEILPQWQCMDAYGKYAHKCRCFNEIICLHCDEGVRHHWIRYEEPDCISPDLYSAISWMRPSLVRRRLFVERPRFERPGNPGINYLSDESLSEVSDASLDEELFQVNTNFFNFFIF